MSFPRFSVNNPVAANLLMMAIIVGGFYCWFTLLREFFPNIHPEKVIIDIRYPGATPEEVEKTVTRKLEQRLKNEPYIEKIASTVVEGASITTVSFDKNIDTDKAIRDIRNTVDEEKTNFPKDVENPEIREVRPYIPVIAVVVYGNVSESKLREQARDIRNDLLDFPEISEAFLSGIRDREIWVEIFPEKLQEYRLTHEQVGRILAASNLDVPGGQLCSDFGNIRVRTIGEKERVRNLEQLVIQSTSDARAIYVKDIAKVWETFEDRVERGGFNGQRAVSITIFKTPEQDALKIAAEVKKYVKKCPTRLDKAVKVRTTTDLSRFISQRLDLMVRNARAGFILVVLALSLFLDLRVAFWVSSGVAISFLGTFLLMKIFGISINLITLFGLIVVLGLIVDDAIVVGENVFAKIRKKTPAAQAAIEGSEEVAMPVVAAVLTTVVAFLPLAFLKGQVGNMISVLPYVVIASLSVSLTEAFLILPAHLGHRRQNTDKSRFRIVAIFQALGEFRNKALEETIPCYFEKLLHFALRWRYVTLSIALAFSLIVFGFVAGGVLPFVLIQKVDAEYVDMYLEMSAGTSEDSTAEVISRLERLAHSFPEVATVYTVQGISYSPDGKLVSTDPATIGQLIMEMRPAEEREQKRMRTCEGVINAMRRKTMRIPGTKKISFEVRSGGPTGADIELLVDGKNLAKVAEAVIEIRAEISSYQGISSVEDDLALGKREIRFQLRESARAMGLTTQDLALQIRHALFGFEAQRLQGENEEVKLRVILPKKARHNLSDLMRLRILTPTGERVPLEEVAYLSTARGYASLSRFNGKRAVTIKAQVDETRGNISQITADLAVRLKEIDTRFPGISISFEGRKKESRDSMDSLALGFPVALLLIYAIIAILFRSYLQPLIVMVAIPYAVVGAIIGHLLLGYPLTFLSMVGVVALAGIVVNDSLILVDFINRMRREGHGIYQSVVMGSKARLRAIILTSLTTVLGLMPLLFEKSFQAQFLIPMAVSIVFGLSLATVLTLVLIPALYLVFDDIGKIVHLL